ncbi:MAG TPA: hypothetical protein DCS93_09545 [Microscillaceae bacterium]|nr:hypothetical protein [Microscillaceae bacterium]
MLFQQFVDKFKEDDFLPGFPRSFKYTFLLYVGVTFVGSLVWATLSIAYQLYWVAVFPSAFILVTVANMYYLYATRNFRIVRFIQVFAGMVLPFMYQWMLGGFTATGAVMLWSLLALFSLLSFTQIQHATYWIILFIVLLVISAIVDHHVMVNIPPVLSDEGTQKFFFTLNIGSIGILSFFVIRAYVIVNINRHQENKLLNTQKEELVHKNQEIRQKNEEILTINEQIKNQQEELHHLNQFKDKLLSIISHDLKSPLNTLQGTLSLFEAEVLTPEELQKLAIELRSKMQATRYLMENILQWAMMQMEKVTFNPCPIDLCALVTDTLHVLDVTQNKSIQLHNHVHQGTTIFADQQMIALVIRNLTSNAIKFTHQNGQIQVSAQRHNHSHIEIAVQDNGLGIPENVMPYIFDSNHTYSTEGTAQEKGTGLGLLLCKEFIEKNHGKIWVESTQGVGTTFKFTLPQKSLIA